MQRYHAGAVREVVRQGTCVTLDLHLSLTFPLRLL